MLNLIDHVFSLNNKKNNDLKVNSSFIYNYYERDETIVDDSSINISDFSYYKKRFIRLDLENHNGLDRFDYNQNNFVEKIEELSKTNSLKGESILFFNKIDVLSPKRKFIINRLDNFEKSKIQNFYNKDKLTTFSNNLNYSHRMSYLIPETFDNNLDRINHFSDFPENDLYLNNQIYNELIFSNKDKEDFSSESSENINGSIFNKCKVLERTVNEIDNYRQDYSIYNAIRCGLLIEKFVLENDKYRFLCGKFITKTKNSNSLELNSSYEDEAVKYGKTYRYVVSEVYLYSELDSNDNCILNKYLICDHPYITRDIECKENEAPPPPNNLKFRVTREGNLNIKWDEPSDYQYDARGYQILKRHSLEEPFRVIAQLEGHSSNDLYEPEEIIPEVFIKRTPDDVKYSYTDFSYEKGRITIYSIRTIDAHGLFSNYSEQIAILYDPFEDKLIYDLICYEGSKRETPNENILEKSKFFDYDDNLVDNLPIIKNIKNIKLYITPDFGSVESGENKINVLENNANYKFTILRVNDLKKYEKQFKIINFI